MAFKEIIVYLDPTHDSSNRLKFAVGMAASHGARLIGMDACTRLAFEEPWRDRSEALPDVFETAIKQAGVKGIFRASYSPHYADLIIASQVEDDARPLVVPGIPEDVLVNAGVPVMLFPYGFTPRPVGESIIIAWKASREATRAVHDALPLLRKAKTVNVFTFAPGTDASGKEPDLLVDHLKEHGVTAKASRWTDTGEISAVEALFASLDYQDADMVVAGAYGHSRWAESLFGGVSHALVRQPSLPVFLSH